MVGLCLFRLSIKVRQSCLNILCQTSPSLLQQFFGNKMDQGTIWFPLWLPLLHRAAPCHDALMPLQSAFHCKCIWLTHLCVFSSCPKDRKREHICGVASMFMLIFFAARNWTVNIDIIKSCLEIPGSKNMSKVEENKKTLYKVCHPSPPRSLLTLTFNPKFSCSAVWVIGREHLFDVVERGNFTREKQK